MIESVSLLNLGAPPASIRTWKPERNEATPARHVNCEGKGIHITVKLDP